MRVLVLAAFVAMSASLLGTAHARPEATSVFDRTFSCEAGYLGGIHQVQLSTSYEAATGASRRTGIASVTKDMWAAAYAYLSSQGVGVHRLLCAPSRTRVELTTKGMRGGIVPALGSEAMCETPKRVLVRVRAVFAQPPNVVTSRQHGFAQLNAWGSVKAAAVAVASPTGRSIAYMSVNPAKAARLFTVRTCKED